MEVMAAKQSDSAKSPSYLRLREAAKEAGLTWAEEASEAPAIAAWLGLKTPQHVNNWASRGVSKDGALRAQARGRHRADWILYGGDAKFILEAKHQHELPIEEPVHDETAPAADTAIRMLREALLHLDEAGRDTMAHTLARFARDPEGETERTIKLLMASVPTPPPPAPTPTTKKKGAAKAVPAKRSTPGRTALVLKLGGGNRQQLELPIRALHQVVSDQNATKRERDWHELIRAVPKGPRVGS